MSQEYLLPGVEQTKTELQESVADKIHNNTNFETSANDIQQGFQDIIETLYPKKIGVGTKGVQLGDGLSITQDGVVTINSNVSEHIANTESHVTLEKQNSWNEKQNALTAGINIDAASFATGTINVTGALQASQNLADVTNRQAALNNLTSASEANEGQILMIDSSKNLTYVDRYEIASGVVSNEVSAHDLRDDGFDKPYIPIMSFVLRNSAEKFEVEFTIMTCDNIGGVSTYNSRYFFVHTIQGQESTTFECLNYFGSSSNISYKDVVYTLNDNVLTFYKKKSTRYDWFINIINYISKIGLTDGYATPTFYIGRRADSAKDFEVHVQASDFKDASEISNMVLPTYLSKGTKRESSASVELTPNIFRVFSSSLSSFAPTCINYDPNYECQYKGRFTASANFTTAGTGHDSGNITWVGDSSCVTGGVYEYNIVDNYGLIKKMNN